MASENKPKNRQKKLQGNPALTTTQPSRLTSNSTFSVKLFPNGFFTCPFPPEKNYSLSHLSGGGVRFTGQVDAHSISGVQPWPQIIFRNNLASRASVSLSFHMWCWDPPWSFSYACLPVLRSPQVFLRAHWGPRHLPSSSLVFSSYSSAISFPSGNK